MRKLLLLLLVSLVAFAIAQSESTPKQVVPDEPNLDGTIFDFLSTHEQYTTFTKLLEENGLTARLQEAGSYTVLAISNDAFNSTDPILIDRLADDEEFRLAVLENHIIEGEYDLNALQEAAEGTVININGETYDIGVTGGGLLINDVGFVATRIDDKFTNGVVNAVERLVLPTSLMSEFAE